MSQYVLKDLIEQSKDGEWGKGEPSVDSVEMFCIRGTDFETVRFGEINSVPRRHILKRAADRKTLRPWDLLIEVAGGTKDKITGRTVLLRPNLVNNSPIPITCASFSRFIRFRTELCDPEFMFWYLQGMYASGLMHAYHTQHTGVARFQWTTFSEREPMLIPPLKAQRRIATILSAYDDLIENNLRRIKILEEMTCALYREWFVSFRLAVKKTAPMTASPLGPIPKGWEVMPLSSVVDFAKGRKPSETREMPNPGDVKVLLVDALRGGQPVFASPEKLVLAETHDTLMVMDGSNSCEVMTGHSGAVGSTLGRFRSKEPEIVSPRAIYQFLLSKDAEFRLKNIGAAIPHANKDYILSQAVVIPPRPIMAQFDAEVAPIFALIEINKARVQTLQRTRDLLLPRLLSGEVPAALQEMAKV